MKKATYLFFSVSAVFVFVLAWGAFVPSVADSIITANLVANGDFENTVISNPYTNNLWQVYGGATQPPYYDPAPPIPGWNPVSPYQVELQKTGLFGNAFSGSQYAEIDSPGNILLIQSIQTSPGSTYRINFAYAARPDAGSQSMGVYWNNQLVGSASGIGTPGAGISWQQKSFTVTAASGINVLGFGSISGPVGAGNFIDAVTVELVSSPAQFQCSDGLDNDNDNATDYPSDFSCSSATDNDEFNPKAQCQDGVDNDNDNLTDYPQDPGCTSKQDNDEFHPIVNNLAVSCTASLNPAQTNQSVTFSANATGGVGNYVYQWSGACSGFSQNCSRTFANPGTHTAFLSVTSGDQYANTSCWVTVDPTTTQCSDGIDNDNDGATDYPNDFSCSSATDNDEENPKAQCQDGIDNDNDNLIDYPQDPGCFSKQDNNEFNGSVVCSSDSQCGSNGYIGSPVCQYGNVWQNDTTSTCINPGSTNSRCETFTVFQQKRVCSGNQTCSNGSCSNVDTCTNHSYFQCSGNSVYWYDSCGNRQDRYQACTGNQTCSGNTCVNQNVCTQNSYKQCSGSSLYWYDSCGNIGNIAQVCGKNQTCQNNACVGQNQNQPLLVTKTVRNLSSGNLNWSSSVTASPSDIVQFNVTVSTTGYQYNNQYANNVMVKDTFPANLTYSDALTLDGVANSGNIVSGLNLGNLSQNQTRTITYQAQVAPAQNFSFGTTTLTNSVTVNANSGSNYGYNYNQGTSSASVIVTRSGVAGATNVSTGLTNNLLVDSFLLPLLLALVGFGLYKSGLVAVPQWVGSVRAKNKESLVQRQLQNKITEIKKRETIN